ncbi:uncharacterized protein PV09_01013 [Verruconis gallopava]|uniref:DUF7871 domain-containing protein n=1 Tax=Verruconis gallopava TaxID=253628 RepID=A0A0D2ANK0_9PEZI|nr:uncharacterized protein PV09_01013 [Verruconis gallopava]KIW08075.1 hypothetical protein PV09_01013 [Verruconis gallopava]
MTGALPKNCCGRSGSAGCVCAAEAKCSCGKNPAMHCNCEKAATENQVPVDACACGMREKGSCTCNRAAMGISSSANETDFTGKA